MGKLITTGITSLDGYVNDARGSFEWAAPDPELHAFVNELERTVGTHLYGRRMYEVMRFWEGARQTLPLPPAEREWAKLWEGLDKVVYSSTLQEVTTARTRLESDFDPAFVRKLVDEAPADVSIGGPTLAAHAWRAGLIDEIRIFAHPVVVGGGTRFFPPAPERWRWTLALLDQRRFASGVVYGRYAVRWP